MAYLLKPSSQPQPSKESMWPAKLAAAISFLAQRRNAKMAKPASGWRAPRAQSPKKNCVASRRGGCRADGLPGRQAPRATNYAPKREYGQADEQPTGERLERCHRRKTASPRDAAIAELTGCQAGKRLERLTMRRSANTAKPTSSRLASASSAVTEEKLRRLETRRLPS